MEKKEEKVIKQPLITILFFCSKGVFSEFLFNLKFLLFFQFWSHHFYYFISIDSIPSLLTMKLNEVHTDVDDVENNPSEFYWSINDLLEKTSYIYT